MNGIRILVGYLATLLAISHAATLQLGPGFHTQGQVYFTTGPRGTLQAIQMSTGKTLWDTRTPTRIFATYQDAPLAIIPCARSLCIALFQSADGRQVWQSAPLPLPNFAPIPDSQLEATNPVGNLYLHDTRRAWVGVRYAGAIDGALHLHIGSASKYWHGVPPPPGHPIGQRFYAEILVHPGTGAFTVKVQHAHTLHHQQPSPPDPWQASVPELRPSIPASWQDASGRSYEVSKEGSPSPGRSKPQLTQRVTMRALSPSGTLLWQRPLAPIVTRDEPIPQ